jgi:hypothetical protein
METMTVPDTRWASFAWLAQSAYYTTIAAGLATLVGGIALGFWGAALSSVGGYFDSTSFVYQYRPIGFLLIALAALLTPALAAGCRALQYMAEDRADIQGRA